MMRQEYGETFLSERHHPLQRTMTRRHAPIVFLLLSISNDAATLKLNKYKENSK